MDNINKETGNRRMYLCFYKIVINTKVKIIKLQNFLLITKNFHS